MLFNSFVEKLIPMRLCPSLSKVVFFQFRRDYCKMGILLNAGYKQLLDSVLVTGGSLE